MNAATWMLIGLFLALAVNIGIAVGYWYEYDQLAQRYETDMTAQRKYALRAIGMCESVLDWTADDLAEFKARWTELARAYQSLDAEGDSDG